MIQQSQVLEEDQQNRLPRHQQDQTMILDQVSDQQDQLLQHLVQQWCWTSKITLQLGTQLLRTQLLQ